MTGPPLRGKRRVLVIDADTRYYGCAKRGCDAINAAWESFDASGKGYCLDHIPLRSRLRLWWQERRGR